MQHISIRICVVGWQSASWNTILLPRALSQIESIKLLVRGAVCLYDLCMWWALFFMAWNKVFMDIYHPRSIVSIAHKQYLYKFWQSSVVLVRTSFCCRRLGISLSIFNKLFTVVSDWTCRSWSFWKCLLAFRIEHAIPRVWWTKITDLQVLFSVRCGLIYNSYNWI